MNQRHAGNMRRVTGASCLVVSERAKRGEERETKKPGIVEIPGFLVGPAGFEPATPCYLTELLRSSSLISLVVFSLQSYHFGNLRIIH